MSGVGTKASVGFYGAFLAFCPPNTPDYRNELFLAIFRGVQPGDPALEKPLECKLNVIVVTQAKQKVLGVGIEEEAALE